jgi:hypothetical protein
MGNPILYLTHNIPRTQYVLNTTMQKKHTNNTYNVHKTGALLQTTEGQYEDLSLIYKL